MSSTAPRLGPAGRPICYSARDRVLGAPGPSSVPDGRVVRPYDPWPTPQVSPGASRVGALRTRITTYGRARRNTMGFRSRCGAMAIVRRVRAPPGPSSQACPATIGGLGNLPHPAFAHVRGAGEAVGGAVGHRPVRSGHDPPIPGMAARGQPARHACPRSASRSSPARWPRSSPPAAPRSRSSRSTRRRRARRTGGSPAPTRTSRRCCRPRTRARRPTTSTRAATARPAALGSLADAGIDGVRFAGATWGLGGSSGLTVATFEGNGPRRRRR